MRSTSWLRPMICRSSIPPTHVLPSSLNSAGLFSIKMSASCSRLVLVTIIICSSMRFVWYPTVAPSQRKAPISTAFRPCASVPPLSGRRRWIRVILSSQVSQLSRFCRQSHWRSHARKTVISAWMCRTIRMKTSVRR